MLWLMLFVKDMPLSLCLGLITILIAICMQYMYYLKDVNVKGNDHFVIIGSSLSIYVIIIFPIFVLLITLKHADEIVVANSGMGGWLITILGLMLVVIVNLIVYDASTTEDKPTPLGNWKYPCTFWSNSIFGFFCGKRYRFYFS